MLKMDVLEAGVSGGVFEKPKASVFWAVGSRAVISSS